MCYNSHDTKIKRSSLDEWMTRSRECIILSDNKIHPKNILVKTIQKYKLTLVVSGLAIQMIQVFCTGEEFLFTVGSST